jgi:hypothetical protein
LRLLLPIRFSALLSSALIVFSTRYIFNCIPLDTSSYGSKPISVWSCYSTTCLLLTKTN